MDRAKYPDRTRRLSVLARTVAAGNYRVPAEYVADAILYAITRRPAHPFGMSV